MSFSDLGLAPELLRAVSEKSYTEPTPIQMRAIPAVLAGRDVLAGAQTGTGKTAAFVLPIVQRLAGLGNTAQAPAHAGQRAPRALVLTPTRELAAQIAESAATYGKYAPVRVQVVFGGVNINPQISGLRSGCDLLIATPGRLLDLAQQGAVNLQSVQVLVLDEADRMLDMGFIRDIRRVIKLLPVRRQNLLFSATYSDEMRQLASSLLHDPVSVEVAARNATADKVDQSVYKVTKDHKRHLLAHLIKEGNWFQVLVFTRTKHGANRLTQQLEGAGIRAAAIHGNKSQGARTRALADFKDNRITVLVATEVAARGLDIKELPHVVNYELPNVPEDYVHRIGRTARAGATGQAVSLVAADEGPLLRDIERLLKRALPVLPTPNFPVLQTPSAPAQAQRPASQERPRRDGGGSGRGRGGAHRDSGRSRSAGDVRTGRGTGGHGNAGHAAQGGHRAEPRRDRSGGSPSGAARDNGFRRQRMH